jgi:circadian clock protein KaiB
MFILCPMKRKREEEQWELILYVSGGETRLSKRAIKNLNEICEEHLRGRYSIEIIDIEKHPEIGIKKNIIASPTTIREMPEPLKRIIGDLSDREKALVALQIANKPQWNFVLYLAGGETRLSKGVIRNLNEICEEYLKGKYSVQIVDIEKHPEIGIEKKIFATPTLIRELPEPLKRIIGDLSDREKALVALEIEKESR